MNLRREATLSLVVGNSSDQREFINTVIDTGFDGFLSLPNAFGKVRDCIGKYPERLAKGGLRWLGHLVYRLSVVKSRLLPSNSPSILMVLPGFLQMILSTNVIQPFFKILRRTGGVVFLQVA